MPTFPRICAILAAALFACAGFAADKITQTISGIPAEVVEGQPLPITVDYDIAPELGEVTLHVELKTPRNAVVLSGDAAQVSGKGRKSFALPAPKRADETEVFYAVWYGPVWTQAIIPIITTDPVAVITPEDEFRTAARHAAADAWQEQHKAEIPAGGAVGVLLDNMPGLDKALAASVSKRLTAEGLTVIPLSAEDVCNVGILTRAHFRTLALTSAQVYPAEGAKPLERYLAQGGNILALNTPAFHNSVRQINGKWMSDAEIRAAVANQKPERILYDFETGSAKDWGYASGPNSPADYQFVAGGHDGTGHALHCVIPKYESWNTFAAPPVAQPFGPGQTLTCFWAKGAPQTTRLAVEWVEKDKSRWIATVDVTPQWKYIVLTTADFAYWQDNPSKGRGGAGDHFKPENAERLTIGISGTHTQLPGGPHEFWVDDIGVAKSPFGAIPPSGKLDVSPIEMLCPEYKFFHVTDAATMQVSDKQCLLKPAKLTVPEGLMSVQPRPQGTGYNRDHKWRFIPLIEAFDKSGELCGTPACMVINRTGRFKNSIVTSFALPASSYADPKVLDLVAGAAQRMQSGLFLFEGGSDKFAYFPDATWTLGARTINTGGGADPQGTVKLTVEAPGKPDFEQALPLTEGNATCQWSPGKLAGNDYTVTCTLLDAGGKTLDRLSHPVVIWRPAAKPDFMKIENGQFMLHGKPWRAHGVNYMPASGIGMEEGEYFELWMSKQSYDPVIVERDLRHMKAMGLNMVTVFCYFQSLDSGNLLDCLERCRRNGLMVNLSLRPGTPLDFEWDKMKALIEAFRIAQNDTVFAYDLAWEPQWGNHEMLKRWDGEWEKWVVERYGSIANAEADWGVPIPRDGDKVTGPSDQQENEEGPQRVMICAYRRFLDDLLEKKHAIANGLVKSIDPNHYTAFRMSCAGDPGVGPSWLAYDFRGLARSVDIMEPEGYGRIGDWNQVRMGRFTADYARCMAPGRPVMWAEFGWSPYGDAAWDISPTWQKNVGDFYGRFYRMVQESQANGTVSWWWPGGFRYGENSDYGIINPDGSDRPVSRTIRDWAPKIAGEPRSAGVSPARPVDEWITIDRDATGKGIFGVYQTVKDRYFALIDQGKNPGLRTDGYGLTSATAPRKAVGNTEYKPGKNPHKYLNAEIDRIEFRAADGTWQPVPEAGLHVTPGAKIALRVTVGNTGEAKWLKGPGAGMVALMMAPDTPLTRVAIQQLEADVPFMGTARAVIEFTPDPAVTQLTFAMFADPDILLGEHAVIKLVRE